MWKAEGLLVKPGFNEAGQSPGRCPIHENTIQNYQGRGLAGETRFKKARRCPIEIQTIFKNINSAMLLSINALSQTQ